MNLARRSLRSTGFTVASSGFQAIVQFGRSILLARLLAPDQFGIYAYAVSLVMLTYALPGFGMGAALTHRSNQSEGEIARRVHFSLNLILNIIWALTLILAGLWLIEGQNQWVFRVILATQIADNLTGTARSKLTREVAFQRIAIIESINTIIGSGIAVFLAWKGAGVWSLVSTDVTAAFIGILGFYVIHPVWRPRLGWSREVASYMFDFGRRSFGAILFLRALDRVDDLWVGTFLGKTALGFYSRAYTFATYPRKLLANPVNLVAGGTFAALKGQPKKLSQAFFRVNAFLIRSGFLFAGILFLIIPEFIHLIIGDKWLPMMLPFRLMLVYTLLDPIKTTIGSVFVAIGLPEIVTRARFWQLIIMLVGLFTLGPWLGISGVAIAVDVMLLFGIVVLLWQVRPYVKFSVNALFFAPLIALISGLGVALAWNTWINPVAISPWSALQKSFAFCLLYVVVLIAMEGKNLFALVEFGRILFNRDRQN